MLNKELFNSITTLSDYQHLVYRLVESQEYAAMQSISSSAENQSRIEELLDDAKPNYREGTKSYHYLIKTAFRYPPLTYGSRFGSVLQKSLFYASESISGVIAESAYYRFLLSHGHLKNQYQGVVQSEHLIFSVNVRSEHCLNLCSKTFKNVENEVINKKDYGLTQSIGAWVEQEKNECEVIRFKGARETTKIKDYRNVGIRDIKAITSKDPVESHNVSCSLKTDSINFSSRSLGMFVSINKDEFFADNQFPIIG